MCVAAYYTSYSSWSGTEETSYDTHADSTITITNSSNSGKLEVGANTISATTVCKEAKTVTDEETGEESVVAGDALKINDIIVTICENTDGTYTYIVTGIGYDGADYYTLDASGALTETEDPDNWPSNWSEYRFDASEAGTEGLYLWVFSNGTMLFGTEDDYGNFTTVGMSMGTNGYWGYDDDDALEFVGHSSSSGDYLFTRTDNADGSVTLSGSGMRGSFMATIPDLGCLVGDGYDMSEFELS